MSHEMEILHRGAALGAAIRRRTQVIPAIQAQPQPPPPTHRPTRTEQPARRCEGEEQRGEPERHLNA